MSSPPLKAAAKPRPKYYDLNLLNLPMPGLVSIFHRITGVVMFLMLIPLSLWILQSTLTDSAGFAKWQSYYAMLPVKLILIGFVWAFMHHLFAGIRYLLLDLHIGIAKEPAQSSAKVVLALGIVATALFAYRIW
jgi:succinate dehydrogenase / fumarate reductase, cytochrome b subunit